MILEHYRDLSPDWLLFGSGSKLRGGIAEESKITAITTKKSKIEQELEANLEKTKKTRVILQKALTSVEKSLIELTELRSKC